MSLTQENAVDLHSLCRAHYHSRDHTKPVKNTSVYHCMILSPLVVIW